MAEPTNLVYNERLKLLATALSALGVGVIVAGIVAPLVDGRLARADLIVVWLAAGGDLIALALLLLGRLRE